MTFITPALQTAFDENRAAIRRSLATGIASPDGCNVCGNTVEVRGYDCFPCEVAYDAPVRNTGDLAAAIGRVLENQIDAERSGVRT